MVVYMLPNGMLSNGDLAIRLTKSQITAAKALSKMNLGQRDAILQYSEDLRIKRTVGTNLSPFKDTRLD